MKSRRFFSIRNKLLVMLCLMITVPFLISGYLTWRKYSDNMERDARTYSDQIAEQVAINLERYLKEMERITIALYYDESVLNILSKHNAPFRADNYLTTGELSRMNQLISSAVFEQTEVEGVFIFARDGSLFSNLQETAKLHWEPDANDWMTVADVKNGGLVVLPPGPGPYYLDEPREVLSIARLIKDPYRNVVLGYVKVDLTSKGFKKILSSAHNTDSSRLYIFNEHNQLLFPFADSGVLRDVQADLAGAGDALVSERQTDYGGLRIVGVIPRSDLLADANRLISYTVWISIGSLLLAYIVSLFVSHRMVKPIQTLHVKMKRVQNGELGERAEVTTSDEIGLLTAGFNSMIAQLDIMIKENYELSLREKEAELAALQSQINPHFLYNTLESISMTARKEQQGQWSDVIASLGDLLRYTVDKQERLVPLSDELAFIEHYLNIQSFRLESRLTANVHVDFSHESVLVPKLLLQPLVENAIEHGMGNRPLTLTVSTRVVDQDLYICVQDDGNGMDEERMRQIERHLDEAERSMTDIQPGKRKKGFALRNIHRRLRILYGQPYGLYMDRSAAAGASFYVKIPFQWKEMTG